MKTFVLEERGLPLYSALAVHRREETNRAIFIFARVELERFLDASACPAIYFPSFCFAKNETRQSLH